MHQRLDRLARLYLGLPLPFWSLLISHTVVAIPYILRTIMGVYRGIPSSFEEAASVLGADRWQVFTNVTLPPIRHFPETRATKSGNATSPAPPACSPFS